MEKKLQPRDAELYRRCGEVLHYIWDPIGVSGVPQARDEYDSYVPQVFGLVRQGADKESVADYLLGIETGSMSVEGSREGALATADVLLDWKEWIWERFD